MNKYIKKPIVIEAVQWTGENVTQLEKFTQGNAYYMSGDFYIKTLEGEMRARQNDFIIKGIGGEFYPCKPDIFEKTYDNYKGEDNE